MSYSRIYGCDHLQNDISGVFVDRFNYVYLITKYNRISLIKDQKNNFKLDESITRVNTEKTYKLMSTKMKNIKLDHNLGILDEHSLIKVILSNFCWIAFNNTIYEIFLKIENICSYNDIFIISGVVMHDPGSPRILTIITSATETYRYEDYYSEQIEVEVITPKSKNIVFLQSKLNLNKNKKTTYRFAKLVKHGKFMFFEKVLINIDNPKKIYGACYRSNKISILFLNNDNELTILTKSTNEILFDLKKEEL